MGARSTHWSSSAVVVVAYRLSRRIRSPANRRLAERRRDHPGLLHKPRRISNPNLRFRLLDHMKIFLSRRLIFSSAALPIGASVSLGILGLSGAEFLAENTPGSYAALVTIHTELDMSTDTEREIERERTTDKGRDKSRAGYGRERATVFKSKTGVGVVEMTLGETTGTGTAWSSQWRRGRRGRGS